MKNHESIYKDLQEHLDKQAVGFPATKSGVEIRILEELFTPEQAELALYLNYKPQTVREIYANAGDVCTSVEEAQELIDGMVGNGSIGVSEAEGTLYYYLMPFLIGIIELHSDKASPDFYQNYTRYFREGFGRTFIGTKVSQMRTIPVEKSIEGENIIATYDHVIKILQETDGPITISPCMCREGAKSRGNPCKATSRKDTCMALGDWAKNGIRNGTAQEITREEAIEILRLNQEDGLVLQPTNYQNLDFICSCCGDCCGVLSMQKKLPKPAENWAHNFNAAIDTEACTGCGICIDRCQMNALTMDDEKGCAILDLDRCFGCGNCVVKCPSGALKLVEKENAVTPPEDRLELYEILINKED